MARYLRSRKDIERRIRTIDRELARRENQQPFNCRADEFLQVLAQGQKIRDEAVAAGLQAFLEHPVVRDRLDLFRERHVLEERLEAFNRLRH